MGFGAFLVQGPCRAAAAGGHLALLLPKEASGEAPETETNVGDEEDPAWMDGYNAAKEEIGGLEGPTTENTKIIQREKNVKKSI